MREKYDKYKENNDLWVTKIPEHWSFVKLKYVVSCNDDTLSVNESDDFLIKYIEIGDVSLEKGVNNYIETNIKEAPSRARRIVKTNDIIISTVRTYLKAISKISEGQNGFIVSTGFAVLRARDIQYGFLNYVVQNEDFISEIISMSVGASYPAITSSNLINISIPLPTKKEQLQIAQYLDHQTATIDQLIQQKEKQIALLKEKKQSIINEAVTKGLNLDAKMKDSGIIWMGKIPSHWKVARIGHYTQLIRGASPRPAGDPRYFGGDFMPWITVGEVTNGNEKFVLSTENYLTKEGSELSRIIYPETLLLSNSGATLGVPKISKITGCINDGSVAFISLSDELERDFLFYFFKTHTEIYRQEMSGYGQPNLNTEIIKSTRLPLPPINEQIEIVNFIEREFIEFDKIISLSDMQIEKLKEYRQSIISEAVTGKIDVREWRPNKKQVA
jgi:type I restriction enzyme, S subunit